MAEMPYDEREASSPGVFAAGLMILRLLDDERDASDEEDQRWLDTALDVHERQDGLGKAKLASLLHGFVLQEAFYTLSEKEKRSIRQAVGNTPLEADLGDGPDVTVEQKQEIIRSLVQALRALFEAYDALDRGQS